ncbi:MAG: biopolymer transporter ExbD [Planctomycetota bacterium]|nr:biopolymer transporter ExbD [Planctomycetota bacterium]
MSYEDQPRSSSSGTVIAVVAVVVLLMMGGLLVLGLAGFFFLRLSVAPQFVEPPPPPVLEQRVTAEPARPVELAAEGKAQEVAEVSSPAAVTRKITVRLDQHGKILADGQTMDLDGLKNLLVKAREDGTIRLEVVVEVDRQCLFEHVAAVQAICKEVGVDNVQVQALTASSD